MRDVNTRCAAPIGSTSLAPTRRSCTRRDCGSRTSVEVYEGDTALGGRASPLFAPRCPPNRLRPTTTRCASSRVRPCPPTPNWSGARGCSTSGSTTRLGPIGRASPSTPASGGSASGRSPCCGSCRRVATCAPSSFRAIPASSGSIRAGIRPPGDLFALGFFHILDGTDHLLFLLCLVIPFRRLRPLVLVVTAFTVAHSITLVASAFDLAPSALWFPPLIETFIATSIVYMALENIVGPAQGAVDGRLRVRPRARLRVLLRVAGNPAVRGFPSADLAPVVQRRRRAGPAPRARLLVPALDLLFRSAVAERVGTIILSALVAHTAWHWMIERLAAAAVSVCLAGADAGVSRERDAVDDGRPGRHRSRLVRQAGGPVENPAAQRPVLAIVNVRVAEIAQSHRDRGGFDAAGLRAPRALRCTYLCYFSNLTWMRYSRKGEL